MSLVTPDFGLLFWMVLIFGIVFFLLAKFGFPIITRSVDRRNGHIRDFLSKAEAAEERMSRLAEEQQALIEQTRREQARILKEATQTREQILAAATQEAQDKAATMLDKARTEIAAEKESALREVRAQVAELSIGIAEKVLRKEMEDPAAAERFVQQLTEEI